GHFQSLTNSDWLPESRRRIHLRWTDSSARYGSCSDRVGNAKRTTRNSLSFAGGCELIGTKLAVMKRIPVRVTIGNRCKRLTGLLDELVPKTNSSHDILHSCS